MTKPSDKAYRLAVDIGGTFTDLVVIDETGRQVWSDKVLTTPDDPARGVLHGLSRLMAAHGFQGGDLANVIHATTLVTNAIIERKGAVTGFITTKGFQDILHIGREIRYDLYDMAIDLPPPLVPRHLVREVEERVDNEGNVVAPVSEDEVRRAAAELAAEGAEAISIGFLHSFMRPAHEERAEAIVRQDHPQVALSVSSRVAPEIREFERFSTTVANAYVQPLMQRYLAKLSTQLQEMGVESDLHLMLSNGGIASVNTVRDFPVRLVESGPAAGVLAATFFGSLAGLNNIIAFDMGGTTAKICLVNDGQPGVTYTFEVARARRFKRGSGLPVKVSALDLIEIGAGGGSIARVDSMGLLQVGPESSGASPGPACYSLGGTHATVTDSDLLLGYVNPAYFLGGEMPLDVEAAKKAVDGVATRLGLDGLRTAWGIHDLVNENMASAMRIHIAEKGQDPRKYTLVATGGAGPVHAYHVAAKLNMRRVVCPRSAGVASSLGLLVAPPKMDLVRAYPARLDELDWEYLAQVYREMEEELRARLAEVGVKTEEVELVRVADMRYVGQGHEVHVRLPDGPLSKASLGPIMERFQAVYQTIFGRVTPGVRVEGINWRLFAQGKARPLPPLGGIGPASSKQKDAALKGTRAVYFPEYQGYHTTPVYDRYRLPPSVVYAGPAVVEERESTTVVGPSGKFHADATGNLVIELG
ncbi:MAG: hydantoinase/oxoprolinase family protein [Chloroflexi bacterium]|nr:hydantoinase/oxoprolinase family protein [Chloroflexota bacterium]